MAIRKLTETPHQLLRAGARADRVAERDPTAAGDLIHQEGIGRVVEEQPLVAGQRRVRQAVIRAVDDGARAGEILGARDSRLGRAGPQQIQHEVGGREHHHRDRGAQHPRRVGMQRERPPELIRIGHVAIDEKADPDRQDDDPDDAAIQAGLKRSSRIAVGR